MFIMINRKELKRFGISLILMIFVSLFMSYEGGIVGAIMSGILVIIHVVIVFAMLADLRMAKESKQAPKARARLKFHKMASK